MTPHQRMALLPLQQEVIAPEAQAAEQAPAAPLPSIRTFFLGGIFTILALTVLREASGIIMPIVFAFVLKLVLQPVLRRFERAGIRSSVAAILIIAMIVGGIIAFGTVLSVPAADWTTKIPGGITLVQERLGFLSKPLGTLQKLLLHADTISHGGVKVMPVVVEGSRLSDRIFAGTQAAAGSIFTTMLVLFFLLASGDTFLRKLVEILPRFSDKRQAVDISMHIERDISRYLLTITMMNAVVGAAAACIMFAFNIPDPLLWAAVAFLFNYVPIVGPLLAAALFFFIGLLSINAPVAALLPGALFLCVHILEGTFITPMLIARRFILNPVLVILSLLFWYWMWGFLGAILAMPILAILKIVCDHITSLRPLGHLIEG